MTTLLALLAGALLAMALVMLRRHRLGFLGQRPEDYAAGETFDLRRQLRGPLLCDGVIYGPTGRVASRFTGHFDVRWQGNTGVMDEHFTYDDGSEQRRSWTLTLGNDGGIRARAADLVGEGRGVQMGSAVRLQYRLRLSRDQGGHVLDTTDWMYLAPNGTIVNRSQFRKFGITVAELFATIRPREAT
ncbi:MAG: DUF3833 family protein [Rhodobacteraceae bacterium]|nr:MAG: DUF3833 family protein [Paracoccaceae bacterium]